MMFNQSKNTNREKGYYWINMNNWEGWTIWLWDNGAFFRNGAGYPESSFEEKNINEKRILNPDEQPKI